MRFTYGGLKMDINELIEKIKENLTDPEFIKYFTQKFAAFEKSRQQAQRVNAGEKLHRRPEKKYIKG
jgi:hypothetical protein